MSELILRDSHFELEVFLSYTITTRINLADFDDVSVQRLHFREAEMRSISLLKVIN